MFDARKDAKIASFANFYGGRPSVCPVCGKNVTNLAGHAEYMSRLRRGVDPQWEGHLALQIMES